MGKRRIKVTRVRHRRLAPQRVWSPTLLDEAFVEACQELDAEIAAIPDWVTSLVKAARCRSEVAA